MTPDFNAADSSTWLPTLTIDQVAAIYQRAVGGLRKAVQRRRFIPAPYQVHPYRWRKADVVRHLEGSRAGGLRRVG